MKFPESAEVILKHNEVLDCVEVYASDEGSAEFVTYLPNDFEFLYKLEQEIAEFRALA